MSIVDTHLGPVRGAEFERHEHFRGIPYALSPVGDLRFRAPVEPEPWDDVRAALEYGLAAPQNPSPLAGMDPGEQGEDCLSLNVYTPKPDGKRRPVMVWLHGGGFTSGASSQAIYEGKSLCTRGDLVLVTVNYRLGVFGYAAGDGFDTNVGQHDMIAALRWVQRNIEAFGGDPENVTIFGESAGGMATSTLLAMPAATGLFHKAIPQSGAAHNTLEPAAAEEITSLVISAAGVDHADQLRSLPTDAVLKAQLQVRTELYRRSGLPFAPSLDGDSLPAHPISAVAEGGAADIPLLVGTTLDENKLFTMGKVESVDDARLAKQVARIVGEERAPGMIDAYTQARADRGASVHPGEIFDAIVTDFTFRIPAIRLLEAQAPKQADTYAYLFAWKSPARRGALGACHAVELAFVFDTLDAPGMHKFSGSGPEAENLARQTMDAWISFARTGDPNCDSLPEWNRYDADLRSTMFFDRECSLGNSPLDAERAAWEGIL